MTSIIILLALILLLLFRLVLLKKWKAFIWTMASLVILTIAGWFLFKKTFSAFGSTCEEKRRWEIEKYVIIEEKCIGFAGPHYFPKTLYKDGRQLGQSVISADSNCLIEFVSEHGVTWTFDLCTEERK